MSVMPFGMKSPALFLLCLCLAAGAARADDQVRRIQEALRKRNLYFGEIDGRKNDEVTGAIKRFQQRQGFAATGEVTPTTLTSLGISGASAPGEEWPEGPVLKSDAARQISEEDRRFLEEHPSSLPDPIADAAPEVSPAAPPVVIPPEAAPPPRKPPERPERPERPESPPSPPAATEETDAPAQFVRRYLAACETNRLSEEMSFYAPRMSYFDHGQVDTAFVTRDVERFYKRWPHRHYELLDCKITPIKEGEWEARFRIAFHYTTDQARAVSGRSLNLFRIQKNGEGLHFISMKEQVLRE